MTVDRPTLPAVPEYPTTEPHKQELDAAQALFEKELSSLEGWDDQGERDGVQLHTKPDPDDPNAVPTVRGECLVQNCTSDAFLAVIQLPGMRKRWDPRFEDGWMLRRFNRLSYEFYTTMLGFGWLVYPRDIVGVQRNLREQEGNKEIKVVQTSIVDEELAKDQSGKTRATLSVSGWKLTPQGEDLLVTYIVKISLNGSMPLAMVHKIAGEIPLCTGRARDVYYSLGHAPYVRPTPEQPEPTVIFHTETLDDLTYECTFISDEGAMFDFAYDLGKFYLDGVVVDVLQGGEGVETRDDEKGTVRVKCSESGKKVTVRISPK